MRICVYCASSETIDPAYRQLATDVGSRLAADGHALVSGGGRVSMMGDVARAARAGGAHTTGVIPRHLVDRELADVEADELVVVDTMRERKRVMDESSDAFLALPGGLGTFEELFEVWTARSLSMHDKPVVVLDPDGFYDPLWTYLDTLRDKGFVRQWGLDALARTTTVDAAFAALTAAAAPPPTPAPPPPPPTGATEVITNLHTDDTERAREFFGLLGLTETTMDQGWVARFSSRTSGASVQVVTRDATAPEDSVMTVKVVDVDAVYDEARRRGYEIVHPIRDEPWGIRRFFVRSPDGHVVNVARHG